MNDKFLVDTCILMYLVDKTAGEKHKKIAEWFSQLNDKEAFVAIQNLREFANCSLKKTQLTKEETVNFIDLFLNRFNIIQETVFDTLKAITFSVNRKNFYDSLLATTMLRNYITTIVTENTKDFEELGIKTINPLK